MLTKKQLAAREGYVTASFIPALMAGKQDRIMDEYRRLVGDPNWKPEDFSSNWSVQFGSHVEKFVLDWHQKKTGMKITLRGEFVACIDVAYVGATLDGYREADNCVIDCKVTGKWMNLDDVVSYYTPQVYVQRRCLEADKMALLVVHGGAEPVEIAIEHNAAYEAEIFERIAYFWDCVKTLTLPYNIEGAKPPPSPPVKEYDFSTSNEWCSEAGAWLEHREAAKKFEVAAKAIKSSVPEDAARAFGGGISVSRNKAGSLSIREQS